MGAWGVGHFQNDGAGDFAGDLADAPSWATVRSILSEVNALSDDEYLEGPLCEGALAASAIVAHLRGTLPTQAYPEYFQAIAQLDAPEPEVLKIAAAAVARIRDKSELRDLWDESGSGAEWLVEVEKLVAALES